MAGSGRALGISGWLIAAAVALTYLMASYDVTIQERRPHIAQAAAVNSGPREVKPTVDQQYTDLAAEAQTASAATLLEVDRSLEAAEHEFPSDYRFTYERATLAVYGRAEHHEAFYHLRRAAEKAIRTERALEMLDRLERDGGAEGRFRRLAVGHDEWSVLHEALEHEDRDRLWHSHARHSASKSADSASLLAYETPCIDALAVLRRRPMDAEARHTYHRLREECLRGYVRGQAQASVRSPRQP